MAFCLPAAGSQVGTSHSPIKLGDVFTDSIVSSVLLPAVAYTGIVYLKVYI
jgi:hypothetical protein